MTMYVIPIEEDLNCIALFSLTRYLKEEGSPSRDNGYAVSRFHEDLVYGGGGVVISKCLFPPMYFLASGRLSHLRWRAGRWGDPPRRLRISWRRVAGA